jgi:argininosuccinate lyase
VTSALTGRLTEGPHELLRAEVLRPQLEYEVAHLLPAYVRVEQVLLVEYGRLGVLDQRQVATLGRALSEVDAPEVAAAAERGMSDLAFGLEQAVTARVGTVPPAWHVDRSRNDLQACAQLMHARDRLAVLAEQLRTLAATAVRVAGAHTDEVLPGYTQLQAAQVISPGFWLAALADQLLHAIDRLDATYRRADRCPLGAGAMAGQELAWDRERMARLLGFAGASRHALRAVAGRDWALEVAAELSTLGVALSRFTTDLMTWAGAGHGFVDLPDEWAGISSAMPQKRNFPVLERIRARTGHLTAFYVDIAVGQRSTPYSNGVEVSKEAGGCVPAMFDTAGSVLRLLDAVLDGLSFRTEAMRAACAAEFLGGFTLANLLTGRAAVPWRTAQVITGRYVTEALRRGLRPDTPDGALLEHLAAEAGHPLDHGDDLLTEAFAVDGALAVKRTQGSTNPDAVRAMLADQDAELRAAAATWADRARHVASAYTELDRVLAGTGRS